MKPCDKLKFGTARAQIGRSRSRRLIWFVHVALGTFISRDWRATMNDAVKFGVL